MTGLLLDKREKSSKFKEGKKRIETFPIMKKEFVENLFRDHGNVDTRDKEYRGETFTLGFLSLPAPSLGDWLKNIMRCGAITYVANPTFGRIGMQPN
ncbi:hypothetical protein TNCV_3935591 [Trichonephila clavipes]|nr:hypothetical protein TNCV_3935591 [Trichonephila clavipes]